MVDVSIITMLAISQPKSMVPLLSQLAGCYQDGEFLSALHVERDTAKIISLFKEKVPQIKVIP
jgi:mannitol/fructose-specific phosphotransferase system IIA component (Ntr-type)